MKWLLILNRRPYDGTDVTWNALRLAQAGLDLKSEVRIFLMNDSVDLARKDAKLATAEFDLGAMLLDLEKKGATIKLCTTCINRCGIGKGALLNDAWPGTMKDLASWVEGSERILSF